MLHAHEIRHDHGPAFDVIVLTEEDRYLRRRVIATEGGDPLLVDLAEPTMLRTLAEALHQERLATGKTAALHEDSVFSVRLVAAAMFGEALIGPLLTWSAGLHDDPSVSQRFRTWLAGLLEDLDREDG